MRRSSAGNDNFRMIDLNLFRVFDAIMEFRSVRKASQALSLTPSAVSHALSRLRESIGDELFSTSPSGMQPTERALELSSAVREGFEKVKLALGQQSSASVAVPRTLRIAATDYACVVLLPPLVKRLARSTPKLDLRVVSSNRVDAIWQLDEGQADLVIGSFSKLPANVCRKRLLCEDEVIMVRAAHPLTRGKVTREKLREFPHLTVPLREGSDNPPPVAELVPIESALREYQEGKVSPAGRATVSVSNFATIISFLQLSDMVAVVPRRLAFSAAAHCPLFLLEPPYPAVAVEIEVVWNRTSDEDLTIRWLLNELISSVSDF